MKRVFGVLFVSVAVLVCACTSSSDKSSNSATQSMGGAGIDHVWVSVSGKVYVNKQPVTNTQLDAEMVKLSERRGAVVYSRENPGANPDPTQDRAIKLTLDAIIRHRLPIKLIQSDPDGTPQGGR